MVDNGTTPPPLPARPLCAAGTCSGALRCGTQTGIKLLRKAKTSRMRTMEGTIAEVIGEVTVQGDDAVRNRSTEQIMRLTKTMEGMSTTQLKLLFDALVRALSTQGSMRVRCQRVLFCRIRTRTGPWTARRCRSWWRRCCRRRP